MAMNIKSTEAHELARELASLEHTTITDAVILSLKEAIERRSREEEAKARAQAMKAIAQRFAEIDRARPGASLQEINEALYDERGLPT